MSLTTTQSIRRLQSPKVEETRGILELRKRSTMSVKWGLANVAASVIFYCNLLQFLADMLLPERLPWVSYADFTLAAIFFLNALMNLYFYVSPAVHSRSIMLSPKQKELLGLDANDKSFHVENATPPSGSHNSRSGSRPSSVHFPLRHQSPLPFTPANRCKESSPYRTSNLNSVSPKKRLNYSMTESPYLCERNQSMSRSFSSIRDLQPSSSPQKFSSPGQAQRVKDLSPIQRHLNQEDSISDGDALDSFIREQSILMSNKSKSTPNSQSRGNAQTVWKYGQMAYNFIPSFRSYQLATRQTKNPSEEDDSSVQFDEVWFKIGITREDVDCWTENLRKWLAETVLDKLVEEIQSVNTTLVQIGCSEMQVGNASISSLRGLSVNKSSYVPSLRALLPYLDIGMNQEYLVERLKELSVGGCLRVYKWNSGGRYKGKDWDQDLPTDAQIIVHLFNTYMDTHLPGNPLYPDGKSFSGMHFVKMSDQQAHKGTDTCIYQSRSHPPHFKVKADGTSYDIPKGRSNLFHSIVIFLYFVKILKLGMLERVNLGLSGINILWILNNKR